MKKTILVGALVLVASLSGSAQEKNTENNGNKVVKTESSAPINISPEQEIKNCESLIEAIDTKEAWIRENPDEMKVAEESGWFENANKTRSELRQRIAELKK